MQILDVIENLNPYPEILQKITTFKGFLEIMEQFIQVGYPKMAAYENTEKLHKKYFGQRKYSDYNSFRGVVTQNTTKTPK